MHYLSTNKKSDPLNLEQAIWKGLPDDNGLFMPSEIPTLNKDFLAHFHLKSDVEIAFEIAKLFFEDSIPEEDLFHLVQDAISFPAPLVQITEKLSVLELFHGPTLAFKDFGARFMAKVMNYFSQGNPSKRTILVATSGDTGSAVANGFLESSHIDVIVLYPKGKVSEIQEKQFTTLGKNITTLEVNGSFDDCQRMVKEAFLDSTLSENFQLSSANSINIARLIPQIFYYFFAAKQLKILGLDKEFSFCVPSGNFGNLCAGILAKRIGLNYQKMIAATNQNKVFTDYIQTGNYDPKPSVQTISNAMDVGNPSNFARLQSLFPTWNDMHENIMAYSFDDEQTKSAIKEVYNEYHYLMCPHTAVAYLGAKSYSSEHPSQRIVFLSTAHPVKFGDVIEPLIEKKIEIPSRLVSIIQGEKKSIQLGNTFKDLQTYLNSRTF